MKKASAKLLAVLLMLVLLFSIASPVSAMPSSSKITTPATGYNSADDVDYQTGTVSGKRIIKNWGARGEDCTFLSSYAEEFYTGNYTFEKLSQLEGSYKQNSVPSSALFGALQDLMSDQHTFYTYYNGSRNVRDYYKYTDCVSNDTSQVTLFYRGGMVTSQWNSGNIWNQEHCWPQSKLGSDEQIGDIMHLRPSNPSENSSRGNTAYGTGGSYYDPGVSVRGDVARITLYMYVRYGLSSKMWGSGGVIQSVDVLLQWMEEDPVDTWEMGKNDAIQSITGTRNVFVDYPELAFLLFAQEVPADMVTPSDADVSSGTTNPPACTHSSTEVRNAKDPTCTEDGYTGDTYCKNCSVQVKKGSAISATGHKDANGDNKCDTCSTILSTNCDHTSTEVKNQKDPTCMAAGYTGDEVCTKCGAIVKQGEVIPKADHTPETTGAMEANCCNDGFSGNTVCSVCGEQLSSGELLHASGEHSFGDWVTVKEPTADAEGLQERVCTVGGYKEQQSIPKGEPVFPGDVAEPAGNNTLLIIIVCAGAVLAGAVLVIAIVVIRKQKK